MIYPFTNEPVLSVYHCPRCDRNYMPTENSQIMGCCVSHAPGDCCHYMEKEIGDKKLKKMRELLREKRE